MNKTITTAKDFKRKNNYGLFQVVKHLLKSEYSFFGDPCRVFVQYMEYCSTVTVCAF